MSDSDDDVNLPSAAECEQRCQQFAAVTCTDSALAMFYLQDVEWNVEKALEAYFGASGNMASSSSLSATSNSLREGKKPVSSGVQSHSNQKRSGDFGDDKDVSPSKHKEDPSRKGSKSSQKDGAVAATGCSSAALDINSRPTNDSPHRIRLMSWNIDGLDQNNIVSRAQGVAQIILREKPDVVFLQEVVSKNLSVISSACPGYKVIIGHASGTVRNEGDYFVAMMLCNDTTTYIDHQVNPFYSSVMARTLLTVEASVKNVDCTLMTSHLESTAEHSAERKKQLKVALNQMRDIAKNRTVIFGGDLNLRDKELNELGGIPENIVDVWEESGRRPEARYTWDISRNDNVEWNLGKFKPRCRFDRIYYRPADQLRAMYFELVGLERVQACRRYPSDHWGLLVHFNKK